MSPQLLIVVSFPAFRVVSASAVSRNATYDRFFDETMDETMRF
jgi:hypothetical protein